MTKTTQYKNTPIGPIPIEWEVKKLGDICKKTGSNLTNADINEKDGIYNVYGASGLIKQVDFFQESTPYISIVKDGAGVGRVLICEANSSVLATMDKIHNNENVNLFYLSLLLNNIDFEKYITGSTIPHIYFKDYKIKNIPLPPLPEQQKIAEVLSTWDKAIQETDAIIKKLEARNKALAFSLLTGKKRVKGFKGKWRNTNFGEITEKISRRNKDLINAEVYSVTNTKGFVLQSDHFEGKVAGEDLSNYKVIKKNEFAYNPARINVGSLAYFEDEIGVISSLYVCFKTTEDILDYYLLQYLQTDYVNSRINALGEGGVRIYLWYELFSKIKISLPSLEEQNAIAEILNTANQEVKQYQQKLEALKLQKKGLMQQLLTGKLRTI